MEDIGSIPVSGGIVSSAACVVVEPGTCLKGGELSSDIAIKVQSSVLLRVQSRTRNG